MARLGGKARVSIFNNESWHHVRLGLDRGLRSREVDPQTGFIKMQKENHSQRKETKSCESRTNSVKLKQKMAPTRRETNLWAK